MNKNIFTTLTDKQNQEKKCCHFLLFSGKYTFLCFGLIPSCYHPLINYIIHVKMNREMGYTLLIIRNVSNKLLIRL